MKCLKCLRARLLGGICAGLMLAFAASHAAAETTNTISFANLDRAIPDGSGSGLSLSTNLNSTVSRISSARVRLKVDGEFNGDLYAYLRHVTPGGTNLAILLNRPGRTAGDAHGYANTGLDVTFSATAASDIHLYGNLTNPPAGVALTGEWQPDGRKVNPNAVLDTSSRNTSLNGFAGMDGSGEWTLFVADLESGGTNQLAGWELEIVGPSLPVVNWPVAADIVYGTTLGGAQLNATSPVAGSFSYTPAAGTLLNAGSNQVLAAVFTPTDTANYLKRTNTVALNVQKKPLTITAENKSKTYGAALPGLTVTYEGFVAGQTNTVLTTQPAVGTTATAGSPTGVYPITVSGAASLNYAITHVNGLMTVNPAQLAITANSTNKIYGAALPAFAAGYSGFVNGDTLDRLTTQASLTTTATISSPAGSYPINASGAAGSNYTFSYVPGMLTIAPASVAGLVSVSKNPVVPGSSVTLSCALSAVAPGAGMPSGSIRFRLDGASLALAPITGGVASLTTSAIGFGAHTLVAEYAGDGNFLGTTNALGTNLVVNTPPTAAADAVLRSPTNGLKISVSSLLANDVELDSNDSIRFASFASTSASGGTVVSNGAWLYYTAPAGNTNADTFTYSIADTLGGTSTGTVTITTGLESSPALTLQISELGHGGYLIRFDGIPDSPYDIETTPTLNPANWRFWMTTNTDAAGMIAITDSITNGAPSKFYRTVLKQ